MSVVRARVVMSASAILLALSVPGSRAVAQRLTSSGDPLPRDLVAAVIADAGGAPPDFIIGGLPPILADRIPTPPGARVLGSMLTATSATIAMSFPMRADSVRTLVMRELASRGWNGAPVGYFGGGFRPAATRSPTEYCADGRTLTFSIAVPSFGTTLLRMIVREGNPSCATATNRVSYVRGSSLATSPTLVNPVDALPPSATCVVQGSVFGQLYTAVVRAAMTPEQLMDHYAKQLTDSGFVIQNPEALVREINRTFTRRVAPANLGGTAGILPTQVQTVVLRMSVPSTVSDCRTVRMEASTTLER